MLLQCLITCQFQTLYTSYVIISPNFTKGFWDVLHPFGYFYGSWFWRNHALVFRHKTQFFLPDTSLGTLSANLLGGYLIGLAIAFFASNTALAPEWRLFIITGFLGGLTTFSTFSAEIVTMFQDGKMSIGIVATLLHVIGSMTMTLLGMGTYALIQKGIV